LNWQEVSLDRRSILLTGTKGKRDRRVPLLPGAVTVLEPLQKDIGRVFPEWHLDTVSKRFHETVKGLGIRARLHDLRHSAATYLLKSGVPIQVVKEILGHAHLSTTMIYSHILDEVMAEEMKKLRFE
jgi:integrase